MNKKVIYALTAIALQSVILQPASAIEDQLSSTVRISSNITASPCTVESVSQNIQLPAGIASTTNAGYPFDVAQPIAIKLINCPATTKLVDATFTGTPSTMNGDYFKNTSASAGGAADIDIAFYQYVLNDSGPDSRKLLKNGSQINDIAIANGEASFMLTAQMMNTLNSTKISAGNVSTAISVKFSYK